MTLSNQKIIDEPEASGGRVVAFTANGTASGDFTVPGTASAVNKLVFRAAGNNCSGYPTLRIAVDNRILGHVTLSTTQYLDYEVSVTLAPGSHRVSYTLVNYYASSRCNRDVKLDVSRFMGEVPQTPTSIPTPIPTSVPVMTPVTSPTPNPTLPPHANTQSQIPLSQLPTGNPGSGSELIVSGAPVGALSATGISAFRFECGFTHMNYDDPIVYPGQQGRAHLHTFFGNALVNYATTYSSLLNTGNSACAGGTLNRSSYWVPAVMNGATPVAPDKSIVYYKSGYPSVKPSVIKNLPDGLKMITGSASATGNQNAGGFTFIEWNCKSGGGTRPYIPTCNAGDELVLTIDFPQCWDGKNLDSADHKSHMARPVSYSGTGCPSTHPVALPHITMIVNWKVASGNTAGWRLSSDMYATTSPGGYSAHADYFEGWKPDIKSTFVNSCLVTGKDCQVRWLGDGRALVNPPGVN